jgi:hypothetical protein
MTTAKGTRRRWTAEEETELVRLRDDEGWLFPKIDRRFNRVRGSSHSKYAELKAGIVRLQPGTRELARPKPKAASSRLAQPWSADHMARAETLWRDLFINVHGEDPSRALQYPVFEIIGREIGRTASAIESRLRSHGPTFSINPSRGPVARQDTEALQALVDARARYAARIRQNPCAILMGDPPPGYSALDQRRQQCSGSSTSTLHGDYR